MTDPDRLAALRSKYADAKASDETPLGKAAPAPSGSSASSPN